jgi:hypothetical protein
MPADDDDDIYLGRLTVSVEDGHLVLLAFWGECGRDSTVMLAQVLDCRQVDC